MHVSLSTNERVSVHDYLRVVANNVYLMIISQRWGRFNGYGNMAV